MENCTGNATFSSLNVMLSSSTFVCPKEQANILELRYCLKKV